MRAAAAAALTLAAQPEQAEQVAAVLLLRVVLVQTQLAEPLIPAVAVVVPQVAGHRQAHPAQVAPAS